MTPTTYTLGTPFPIATLNITAKTEEATLTKTLTIINIGTIITYASATITAIATIKLKRRHTLSSFT